MGKKNNNEFAGINIKFFKKNWSFLVLMLIFLLGLNLRSYHIDYPVIGYHNWKEAHYLTEARNFAEEGFFKYGFFVPYRDYWRIAEDNDGVHGDTLPTVSIFVALIFKIFGYKLWAARLVGILFNAFSIILAYGIIKKLSKNETLALIIAFLTAINPLFVFYSHNVQLMNIGIFFGMLGIYLFLKWKEEDKPIYLIASAAAFSFAGLTKYPFLIMMSPLIFIFPYERLKIIKKNYKQYLIAGLVLLLVPAWILYTGSVAQEYGLDKTAASFTAIDFDKVFSQSFWGPAKSYMRDNFTLRGVGFAGVGILLLFILGLRNRSDFTKFLLGYLLGFIVFFIIMSSKLSGHSYHYFPIAFLVITLMGYFFIIIVNTAGGILKQIWNNNIFIHVSKIVIVILLLLIVYNPSLEAKNRQFNTQFPGLDVAGEYLRTRTAPGERIIHSSHQSYGVLWHGDVTGTRGIPSTVDEVIRAEEEFGTKWIFMYNWDFGILQGEVGEYIRNNYHLAQFGFQQTNNQIRPIYFLFKKGGNFSDEDLNRFANEHPVQTREYEFTFGKSQFFYASE